MDPPLTFESITKPHSSVLENGHFVYLDNSANAPTYFSRTVAKYKLVQVDENENENDDDDDDDDKKLGNSGGNQGQEEVEKLKHERKESVASAQPTIHPIQIASARIQTHGIAELSKVINLSTLLRGNEYFGLTSVLEKPSNNDPGSSSLVSVSAATASTATDPVTNSTIVGPTTSIAHNVSSSSIEIARNESINAIVPTATGTTTTTTAAPTSALTPKSTFTANIAQEQRIKENQLRSKYVLKRKYHQYKSSSQLFQNQYKKLKVVTTTQHTIDSRLLELRKRWRLNVPNHGVHVEYPIQPCDVIAVDVDIYARRGDDDDDEEGDDHDEEYKKNKSSVLAKVPRFATIELSNEYNIRQQLERHHRHNHHGHDGHEEVKSKEEEEELANREKKDQNDEPQENKVGTGIISSSLPSTIQDTIAHPFLVTESALNNDFQLQHDRNHKLPMLTLLFQIEKASTGFKQSITLSSNSSTTTTTTTTATDSPSSASSSSSPSSSSAETLASNDEKDITKSIIDHKTKQLKDDELLIQSLQHSLFCASVFDSIRQEITNDHHYQQGRATHHRQRHQQQQQNKQQQQQQQRQQQFGKKNSTTAKNTINNSNTAKSTNTRQQIAWLSSEMEDSFLPAPSLMAGGGQQNAQTQLNNLQDEADVLNNEKPNSPLSVIYCHEGQVKVQLDSEYSLMIKLVDVNNSDISNDTSLVVVQEVKGSGSQSPEQLRLLCRLLLLQAQLVYHESMEKQVTKQSNESNKKEDEASKSVSIDYSAGLYGRGSTRLVNRFRQDQRKRKSKETKRPNILQSCVCLGKKNILERKVRQALKVCMSTFFVLLSNNLLYAHELMFAPFRILIFHSA